MKSKQPKKTVREKNTPESVLKKHDQYWLYAVPLFLVCALLLISIFEGAVKRELERVRILPEKNVRVAPYPSLLKTTIPFVSAYSVMILDNDSKKILYEKNADFRFSMASTTKVMTALAGLDYFKPESILTIQRDSVEGTVVGFSSGQRYYYSDILYGMLLPSGNDAAYAVADNYPGGVDAFVLN